MLTPEQQQQLSGMLQGLGPQAMETFNQFLQPMGQEQMDDIFQKSYVDPAMQSYEQQVLPAIQQRFADANAGSSSALNQALGQSAQDLSTSLGSQYGQFFQNQQGMQQNALNQYLPLMTGQTFSPLISQSSGILGPLVGAAGQAAGAYAASSKDVKENIKPYERGMTALDELEVKQYDYIEALGGAKDRVGLLAEDVPEELTAQKNGVLHVDLYGVMGLMINAIKELNEKIVQLEDK